ncbi:MAG: ECF transporter S component [Bacilli bacterium]|jgi:ECF transporter S component (folate family)|nr:ECF transporter S component [Bacilli bacterium]MDD3348228.1 ECF transporter S component [Bacilli bacterium]MDD4056480.1 ECF transporter S component [Bacilli bacterium]MDY0208950.1 ECF transporter S component [Bacilli bacterium]
MKKKMVFQITFCAIMAALSIVLEKFASVDVGMRLKFTFYGLPLMIIGTMFGPKLGFTTGLVAGVVLQLTSPYGMSLTSPFWALAPIAWGGISGLMYRAISPKKGFGYLLLVVIITSLSANVFNTLAMYMETVLINDPYYTLAAILLDWPIRLLSMIILVVPYTILVKVIINHLSFWNNDENKFQEFEQEDKQ